MPITPDRSRRRVMRRSLVAITAAALALSPLVFTETASAATPSFPDNIVVFPDRDFVSVEGYEAHAGENATIKVTRGTQVMGSAVVPVSGTDVAFEVNHPGGFCWGTGTSLKVTPDIRPGDVVSVTFADGVVEETRTSSAAVTEDMTLNGLTLTVRGRFGPEVNTAFMEQRIINADLVPLIGKRDIRALPGEVTPAATGGYSSGMTFDTTAGTFVATYVFEGQAAADTAAAADLGERAMNWQVEDAAGNRQGLTIAEFGEAGGPGFGGCPLGPGDQVAPSGSYTAVRSADRTSVVINWNPVAAQPGAAPVTGYSVEAITTPPGANGNSAVLGTRTDTTKRQATLTLDPAVSYAYEVRSLADTSMSAPFKLAVGPGDTTLPTLTVTPALNGGGTATPTPTDQVSITSNGQVFFTKDGSPVVTAADMPSDTAHFYTGPIPITELTTLKVVAFDAANNMTGPVEGTFVPGAPPAAPAAPTGLAGTSTQTSVALTWNAGDPPVTGYQVTVYDAGGTALASQPPVTTVPRQTVNGLTPDTTYLFEVRAINAGGTSDPSTPRLSVKTKVPTDQIAITSARWKTGDFKVVGTGSVVGNTVKVYRFSATRPCSVDTANDPTTNIFGSAAVVAAAPPGIGDWVLRLRNGAAPNNNPNRICAVSSGGGVAGPFNVTAG